MQTGSQRTNGTDRVNTRLSGFGLINRSDLFAAIDHNVILPAYTRTAARGDRGLLRSAVAGADRLLGGGLPVAAAAGGGHAGERLFMFLEHEGGEPTNKCGRTDVAERCLRTAVQWRKISFGNRSRNGEVTSVPIAHGRADLQEAATPCFGIH